ncbi:hepatic sodium/bile acid cotransporter-like [Ciona intestinalis]
MFISQGKRYRAQDMASCRVKLVSLVVMAAVFHSAFSKHLNQSEKHSMRRRIRQELTTTPSETTVFQTTSSYATTSTIIPSTTDAGTTTTQTSQNLTTNAILPAHLVEETTLASITAPGKPIVVSTTPVPPTDAEVTMAEIAKRIEQSPALNSAIEATLVVVVIQTMLGLGCTMDVTLIKEHLQRPSGIAIAASCQFGIMPFISFLMAKIFGLDKVAAIAVLVTGCCPGGNLSNLLTYFLYGDMNLSILMSSISTVLALVFMPFCLFIYGSSWISAYTIGSMIPFGGVVLTLIMTLFPVCLGMAIKSKYEKVANSLLKVSLFGVGVAFVALMTLSVIMFGSSIFTAISPSTYVIAFVMPLIGYGSGYLLATGFRLPDNSRRTVAIETGCQNSQLSSTILKMAFANEVMGAYFLFPLYYALFQGLEGLAMVLAFRIYRRYYADESIGTAHSRITYDKFDDEWDPSMHGERFTGSDGGLYQHSSSEESMYGRMQIGGDEDGEGAPQRKPNKLHLKHKFSPGELPIKASLNENPKGDKTTLISGQQTGDLLDYGGLGDSR